MLYINYRPVVVPVSCIDRNDLDVFDEKRYITPIYIGTQKEIYAFGTLLHCDEYKYCWISHLRGNACAPGRERVLNIRFDQTNMIMIFSFVWVMFVDRSLFIFFFKAGTVVGYCKFLNNNAYTYMLRISIVLTHCSDFVERLLWWFIYFITPYTLHTQSLRSHPYGRVFEGERKKGNDITIHNASYCYNNIHI